MFWLIYLICVVQRNRYLSGYHIPPCYIVFNSCCPVLLHYFVCKVGPTRTSLARRELLRGRMNHNLSVIGPTTDRLHDESMSAIPVSHSAVSQPATKLPQASYITSTPCFPETTSRQTGSIFFIERSAGLSDSGYSSLQKPVGAKPTSLSDVPLPSFSLDNEVHDFSTGATNNSSGIPSEEPKTLAVSGCCVSTSDGKHDNSDDPTRTEVSDWSLYSIVSEEAVGGFQSIHDAVQSECKSDFSISQDATIDFIAELCSFQHILQSIFSFLHDSDLYR